MTTALTAPEGVEKAWPGTTPGADPLPGRLDRWLAARGAELVVVLGHPAYYPRFGFAPAAALGLTCKWPVPADAFMALDLRPGPPAAPGSGAARIVEYLPEFDDV